MENDKTVFEKRDFRKTVCPLFGVHFIKTMDVESPESAERKGVDEYVECGYNPSRAEQSRAEQSRAEQSRAEQSRAEHRLTALFLCPAAAWRLKLNTTFVMDNRLT